MNKALTALLLIATPMWSFAQTNSDDGFIDFSIGYQIMCGVRADNSVACETGSLYRKWALPANHPPLVQVDSGASHSCGVTTSGGIWCWGDDDFGKLNAPNDVLNFVSVSVGNGFHSCGVTDEDQIICWGLNTNGQANPPNDGYGFTQVYVGYQTTCGLRTDREIECWGGGDPDAPARIFGNGPYSAFVTENGFNRRPDNCGLLEDGTFDCEDVPSPLLLNQYQDIEFAYPYVCGLQIDGQIECVKEVDTNSTYNLGLESIEGQYTELERTGSGLCALSVDGDIQCFGDTTYNELIPGATKVVPVPEGVSVSIYSDTAIEVTWERIRRPGIAGISGYEVYKNGELQTVTEGTSYFDDTLAPSVTSRYSVRAVSGIDRRSDFSEEVVVDTGERDNGSNPIGTSYTVPARPSEPTTVDVYVYSANLIELIWNRPVNTEAIGYEIRRNNTYIGFTQGISFVDNTVAAENCYRYNILPIHADGHILGLLNAVAATGTIQGCE